MASEYEILFEQPIDGIPAKDVRLPELYWHGDVLGRMDNDVREDFMKRLYAGYLDPDDKDAFSDCYAYAYWQAWKNSKSSSKISSYEERLEMSDLARDAEDRNIYESKMDNARAILYRYVKLIARGLGRSGVVYNDQNNGYTITTDHYDVTSHYDEEEEREKEDSREFTYSSHDTKYLTFPKKAARKALDNEYNIFLEEDPIYKPFKPLLERKKDLSKPVEDLSEAEKRVSELKKKIPTCKFFSLILSILLLIVCPIVPGIPIFWICSGLYVVARKLLDYRYAAEWFFNTRTGGDTLSDGILDLLDFLIKLPGEMTSMFMDGFCAPDNPSRIFFIILVIIIIVMAGAFAAFWSTVPAAFLGALLSGQIDDIKRHKKELARYDKNFPDLRAKSSESKQKLDALLASAEYKQACETNKRLADSYRSFFMPVFDKWTVKPAKAKK